MATGFHGYHNVAPTNFIREAPRLSRGFASGSPALPNRRSADLKHLPLPRTFLEWLAGFTDAEGNFNISLRNFKENTYNSLILTFQIGLHIDDIHALKFIQSKLNCGHISISGSKCNYFVNDQSSLIDIIIPIFNSVRLNSSKHFQFLIFEKAVNLIKNKKHRSPEGRLEIINYYFEMKNENLNPSPLNPQFIKISNYWLAGFTDGDGTFSTNKHVPRLKFENHVKELELLKKIKEYFNAGNLTITNPRKNRISNPMVVLEINQIHTLIRVVIPLFTGCDASPMLQSRKLKDFKDWSIIVNLYYYGYHLLPEGLYLINAIKSCMNNYRLSNNKVKSIESQREIESKRNDLYRNPSPYEIKNGVRYLRGTDTLVSEKLRIISIDNFNNELVFTSISECSKALQVERTIIKKCLLTGESYKSYKFAVMPPI